MQYVIQVLAAILIGISIGVLLGPRYPIRMVGSLIAIALGVVAIFTSGWTYLAVGTAVFLIALGIPARTSTSRI